MNSNMDQKRNINIALILVLIMLNLPSLSYGGSQMAQSFLYENDFKCNVALEPKTFKHGDGNISLFQVSHDNSVGTNGIKDAVTLISFPKNRNWGIHLAGLPTTYCG